MRPGFLKRSHAKVAEFKKDRDRQSDEFFLRDLGIGADAEIAKEELVRLPVAILLELGNLCVRTFEEAWPHSS